MDKELMTPGIKATMLLFGIYRKKPWPRDPWKVADCMTLIPDKLLARLGVAKTWGFCTG
jgi:hypothetical protein